MLDFSSCASWPSVCLLWKMCILVLYPLFYLKYNWCIILYKFSSVQSYPTLCDPMNHSTPSLTVHHQLPGAHSNSHPSSWWCHPAISSSVVPFSPFPQSLPASESFPMSQVFPWGGQSTEVSVTGIQYSDILILYPFFNLQYNWCIIL